MNRFLSLALVVIFATYAIAAQTPTPSPIPSPSATPNPEDEVVKISTSLVQIDVTVTDRKGRIVRDLKPEEIEIYENGKKQPITNFSLVLNEQVRTEQDQRKAQPSNPSLPTVPLKTEQVRRTIALIVDDLTLSFESTYFVRRALKKFVDEQMQEGDLVAIIRAGAGIGALQQFTSDKRILYAAIERIRWNPLGSGGIGAFPPLEAKIDTGAPENPPQAGERTPEGVERENREYRQNVFASGSLGAVGYVIRGMSELPGRKAVMLFSDGFKMFSTDASGTIETNRVLESIRRLVDQANRASVVIYTLDARGLAVGGITAEDNTSGWSPEEIQQASNDRMSELKDSQGGLIYLAQQTGGTSFVNNNDLSFGIRRVLDDQSYYLVGYEPDEATFDPKTRRFNRINVRVLRPDVRVRYRSGFFGVTDEQVDAAPAATGPAAVMRALMSPFGVNGVALRMNALFGSNKQQPAFVRTLLHISASDLQLSDGPNGSKQATFEILAFAFAEGGLPVDRLARSYTMTVERDRVEGFLKDGFVYDFVFPIKKPGAYQMRVALRDLKSEKIGSASQFIEVPNIKKDRLTLSGVGLEALSVADWNKRSTDGEGTASGTSTTLNDTALRQFESGKILSFGFSIYNAILGQTGKPNLASRIRLFKDGVPVFTGEPRAIPTANQSDQKAINFMSSLVLGTSMTPGDYALEVAVTDALSKSKYRTATQYIQFEIVE